MDKFTIEKPETDEDRRELNLHFQNVVLRGYKPENVVVCRGTQETLLAEAVLIELKNDFASSSTAVYRSPDATFQSSMKRLVLGFEKDSDAKMFRTRMMRVTQALRGPGALH